MQLFIEPIDVWLFRDGRPFDALSDHRAESLFPPYPSVMQGAIRSHQLTLLGVDLRKKAEIAAAVGTGTDYKALRICGPLIARCNGNRLIRYFPLPSDAWVDGTQALAIRPTEPPTGVLSNLMTPEWLMPLGEPKKVEGGGWLDEDNLLAYLEGKPAELTLSESLFCMETRIGIGHDAGKRTVREGALFEVQFVRPLPGVGLWLQMSGYDNWPKSGVLRIGGEGHGAAFSEAAGIPSWPAPTEMLPQRFCVYCATPTYFDGGWQPRQGDWGRFFEGEVQLVAAAISHYESIGGFDYAADATSAAAHRPARRFVPAGSVYFFRSDGRARMKPNLIQNAFCDFALTEGTGAEIGFGQVLIKEW